MIRYLFLILLLSIGLSTSVRAQDTAVHSGEHSFTQKEMQPFAHVEVAHNEVAVGTPAKVTIKLYVPTRFKELPEFPSFDGVDVIIKELAQGLPKTEKNIKSAQWTVISKVYWMLPMVAGDYSFKSTLASGVFANPTDNTAVDAKFVVEGFSFTAAIPAGAKVLDPLIVADSVTLKQSWSSDASADSMKQNDAITRTITATIKGSSALFLPQMISPLSSELIKDYPQQQKVTDLKPHKGLGGKREESVSYLAQFGGTLEFPKIEIQWFNITTGEIETTSVAGRSLHIDAPNKPTPPLLTQKQLIILCGLLLLLVVTLKAYIKWLHPFLTKAVRQLLQMWKISEPHAAHKVIAAIHKHDLGEIYRTAQQWLEHQRMADTDKAQGFLDDLLKVSKERYGQGPKADWIKLEQSFRQMRKALHAKKLKQSEKRLPELNSFNDK